MSFIAESPLIFGEIDLTHNKPLTPYSSGMRGIFMAKDGLYEVDYDGNLKRYANTDDLVGQTTVKGGEIFNDYENNKALTVNSHAEGSGTIAASENQHVQGKFNKKDTSNTYAHIIGNGTDNDNRSNAHTVDWNGNAFYAGDVEVSAIILRSSTEGSAKKFRLTIDDNGTLSSVEI